MWKARDNAARRAKPRTHPDPPRPVLHVAGEKDAPGPPGPLLASTLQDLEVLGVPAGSSSLAASARALAERLDAGGEPAAALAREHSRLMAELARRVKTDEQTELDQFLRELGDPA